MRSPAAALWVAAQMAIRLRNLRLRVGSTAPTRRPIRAAPTGVQSRFVRLRRPDCPARRTCWPPPARPVFSSRARLYGRAALCLPARCAACWYNDPPRLWSRLVMLLLRPAAGLLCAGLIRQRVPGSGRGGEERRCAAQRWSGRRRSDSDGYSAPLGCGARTRSRGDQGHQQFQPLLAHARARCPAVSGALPLIPVLPANQ